MKFDDIFDKIQRVSPLASPLSVKEENRIYFLKSWLRSAHITNGLKNSDLDLLAREVALCLAKEEQGDEKTLISRAFGYLYSNREIQLLNDNFTEKYFLQRKFILTHSAGKVMIALPVHWKKIDFGPKNISVGELIVLYEIALDEVKHSSVPTWIKTEALLTLEACVNQPLQEAKRQIMQRKHRLAALMISPDNLGLPEMQKFWLAYQNTYDSINAPSVISTKLIYSENMGVPSTDPELPEPIMKQFPTASDLVLFKKNKREMIAYQKIKTEYECMDGDSRLFLAQRQQTFTTAGYTADPYSICNVFCAKMALSSVDPKSANPRQQFWNVLMPQVKDVFLGTQDSDWPDYGEAIISDDQLINYRKIALMCQHRDVHKILMGINRGNVQDEILEKTLSLMPGFRKLSHVEKEKIENFNANGKDLIFWKTIENNQLGKNAFDFFTAVRAVLDKYRSFLNRNEHLEFEMSLEGAMALEPYLILLHQSNLVSMLEKCKGALPPGADRIQTHLDYLIGFRTLMMTREKSCFNAAYGNVNGALIEIPSQLKEMKFEKNDFLSWANREISGRDVCAPEAIDAEIIKACLSAIDDNQVLLQWVEAEARNGTPLPIDIIVDRFLELSVTMTASQIYNFIQTYFPSEAVILFSEQLGQAQAAIYGKNFFMKHLLPTGVDNNKLKSHLDYLCALKMHDKLGVDGQDVTMKKAITFYLETSHDLYSLDDRIPGKRELLALILAKSTASEEQIKSLLDTFIFPSFRVPHLAVFFSLFENKDFPKILDYFCNKHLSYSFDLRVDSMFSLGVVGLLKNMKSVSDFNDKKSLMFFSRVFTAGTRNSTFSERLNSFAFFLKYMEDKFACESVVLFIMNALENKEGSFSELLGDAIQILCKKNRLISRLTEIYRTGIVPEFDIVDSQINQFILHLQRLNNAKDLGLMLNRIDAQYFNQMGFVDFDDIIKTPADWTMLMAQFNDNDEMVSQKQTILNWKSPPISNFQDLIAHAALLNNLDKETAKLFIEKIDPISTDSVDQWISLLTSLDTNIGIVTDVFQLGAFVSSQENIFEVINRFWSLPLFKCIEIKPSFSPVFKTFNKAEDVKTMLMSLAIDQDPEAMSKAINIVSECSAVPYRDLLGLLSSLSPTLQKYLIFGMISSNYIYTVSPTFYITKNILNDFEEEHKPWVIQALCTPFSLGDISHMTRFDSLSEKALRIAYDYVVANRPELFPNLALFSVPNHHKHVCYLAFINSQGFITRLFTGTLNTLESFLRGVGGLSAEYRTLVLKALTLQFKEPFLTADSQKNFLHFIYWFSADEMVMAYDALCLKDLNYLSFCDGACFYHIIQLLTDPQKRKNLLKNNLADFLWNFKNGPHSICYLLELDEVRSREALEAAGDVLARFKAIYSWLVHQSPIGSLAHLQGVTLLNRLAYDDLEGWKRFFRSTAMCTPQTLRARAWKLAVIKDPLDRRRAVFSATIPPMPLSNVSGILHKYRRQEQLSEESHERIAQVCDWTLADEMTQSGRKVQNRS